MCLPRSGPRVAAECESSAFAERADACRPRNVRGSTRYAATFSTRTALDAAMRAKNRAERPITMSRCWSTVTM